MGNVALGALQGMQGLEKLKAMRLENTQAASQNTALQSLLGTLGQEPKAAPQVGGMVSNPAREAVGGGTFPDVVNFDGGRATFPGSDTTLPALPGRAPMQMPTRPALPATDFNAMVGGSYAPKDLAAAQSAFNTDRMGLLARSFPKEVGSNMASLAFGPPAILTEKPGEHSYSYNKFDPSKMTPLTPGGAGGGSGENITIRNLGTGEIKNQDKYTPVPPGWVVASNVSASPEILDPRVQAAHLAEVQAGRVKWRAANPEENIAHGLPPTAKGAQVSDTGEWKAPERQPGMIGPAYSSTTGQPMGTVDYSDPEVAAKLKSGELLQQPPRVMQPNEVEKLTTYGNSVNGLTKALGSFQDNYGGLQNTGGETGLKAREKMGATPTTAWWSAYRQEILPTLKATVGRSRALLDRLDETTPQPADAPSVVREKLASQIEISKEQGTREGQTYASGGYHRGQIESALGFPLQSAGTIPVAPKPIPAAAIKALKDNPTKAAEFDQYYGSGASQAYLRKK